MLTRRKHDPSIGRVEFVDDCSSKSSCSDANSVSSMDQPPACLGLCCAQRKVKAERTSYFDDDDGSSWWSMFSPENLLTYSIVVLVNVCLCVGMYVLAFRDPNIPTAIQFHEVNACTRTFASGVYVNETMLDSGVRVKGAIPLVFLERINTSVFEWPQCVNNPYLQGVASSEFATMEAISFPTNAYMEHLDNSSVILDECTLPQSFFAPSSFMDTTSLATIQSKKTYSYLDDPIFVLTLDTEMETRLYESLNLRLTGMGFQDVRRFNGIDGKQAFKNCRTPMFRGVGLQPGAVAIRHNFEAIFTAALEAGYERIIVFESDVVFSRNFVRDLDKAANCPRCGQFMFSDDHGGVVMLGASEYSQASYLWEEKQRLAHNPHSEPSLCYNAHLYTYGAFGAIYHRNTFLPMLELLRSEKFAGVPFDHMFGQLALRGFTVRVLEPKIVLADVLHASRSHTEAIVRKFRDKRDIGFLFLRACTQRWPLQDFEFYSNWTDASRITFDSNKDCTAEKLEIYKHPKRAVMLTLAEFPSQIVDIANQVEQEWRDRLDGRDGIGVTPVVFIHGPNIPVNEKSVSSSAMYWLNGSNLVAKLQAYLAEYDCEKDFQEQLFRAVSTLRYRGVHLFIVPTAHVNQLMWKYRSQFTQLFDHFYLSMPGTLPSAKHFEAMYRYVFMQKAQSNAWQELVADPLNPRIAKSTTWHRNNVRGVLSGLYTAPKSRKTSLCRPP